MATETDAARDRVLAARAALGDELEVARGLGSRGRRHPRQDPAQPGQGRRGRRWRGVPRARRSQSGSSVPAGAPSRAHRTRSRRRCCPRRSRRRCARWATTATKVRGALERDFAAYAKQRQKDRSGLRTLIILSVARPLLSRRGQGSREPGCSAPTTRASRRDSRRSASGPRDRRDRRSEAIADGTVDGRDGHGAGRRHRRGQGQGARIRPSDADEGKAGPDRGRRPRRR